MECVQEHLVELQEHNEWEVQLGCQLFQEWEHVDSGLTRYASGALGRRLHR